MESEQIEWPREYLEAARTQAAGHGVTFETLDGLVALLREANMGWLMLEKDTDGTCPVCDRPFSKVERS